MMQGYNILMIQDEMQDRIDELEKALHKLCKHAETVSSDTKPTWGTASELQEARAILQKKIKRRGGNLPRGYKTRGF